MLARVHNRVHWAAVHQPDGVGALRAATLRTQPAIVAARLATPPPLQAFFCSRQFRRCLHLLRGTELIEKDLRFRYLAAR